MFFPIDDYTVGAHTISEFQLFLRADTSGGVVVFNLPAGVESAHYIAKKLTSDANALTINPPMGKTIDGLTSIDILGNKQCIWIVRQADGNYDIIAGGGGGTSTGRDVDYVELAADAGLSTSDSPISGMSIALDLLTAGKVILSATGKMAYGSGAFYSSELTIRVVGGGTNDYTVSTNTEQQGAGSDHIEEITHAGRKGIFLNAGSYTISLRGAASPAGGSLLAGALLGIDIPVLTGGGSIVGSTPTGAAGGIDVSGTYPDDLLVTGLQGDDLPSMGALDIIRRNSADTAWEAVKPVGVYVDDVFIARQSSINIKAGAGTTLTYLNDPTNSKVDVTVTSSGGGGSDDPLWKAFYSAHSVKPANTFKEELYVFPTPDFTNYGAGSASIAFGHHRYTGATLANFGWDIGSAKDDVLFIMGGLKCRNFGIGIFVSPTLPSGTELPDGSFLANAEANVPDLALYKRASGSYSSLGTETALCPADAYAGNPTFYMGLYYKKASNRAVLFFKYGPEAPLGVIDYAGASFAQMRYVGVRSSLSSSAYIFISSCPVGIYTS